MPWLLLLTTHFICLLLLQCSSLASFPLPQFMLVCLNWVSIAVRKHYDQKQLEGEGVTLPGNSSSLEEVRAGTWRQTLINRPWRNCASCLSLYGLLSLLYNLGPRGSTDLQWEGPSHITNKGNENKICPTNLLTA